MCALCACKVSSWRYGPACWLMYCDRARSNGICSSSIAVMCEPCKVTRTCTVPYRLVNGSPSMVRVTLDVAGGLVAGEDADGAVVDGAVVDGAVVGGVVADGAMVDECVAGVGAALVAAGEDLKLASAPSPTRVSTAVGTARRMAELLEVEAFVVDVRLGHVQQSEPPAHRFDETGRPAHEAVAF